MAKRSDFPRRKNDAYDTPEKGMKPLLPFLNEGSRFIEPCAGKGDMVDFLVENGMVCIDYFDIEPRRKDIKAFDAFEYGDLHYEKADFIITNPPWTRKLLHPLIEKWASIKPTWLLFDSDWAFTNAAKPYIEEYGVMFTPTPRLKWIPDSKHSATDNTAWYLFDKNKTHKDMKLVPRVNI